MPSHHSGFFARDDAKSFVDEYTGLYVPLALPLEAPDRIAFRELFSLSAGLGIGLPVHHACATAELHITPRHLDAVEMIFGIATGRRPVQPRTQELAIRFVMSTEFLVDADASPPVALGRWAKEVEQEFGPYDMAAVIRETSSLLRARGWIGSSHSAFASALELVHDRFAQQRSNRSCPCGCSITDDMGTMHHPHECHLGLELVEF